MPKGNENGSLMMAKINMACKKRKEEAFSEAKKK